MAFNAKNLSYGIFCLGQNSRLDTLIEILEAKEPNFLRKLREENGGGGSLRHERPLARPKKQRAPDEDDDEPTYVDEESQNTISKAEHESLIGRQTSSDKVVVPPELQGTDGTQNSIPKEEEEHEDDERKGRMKQQVAVIGVQKRKKAVKVIGDDAQAYKDNENNTVSTESRAGKTPNKRKKVKLSFHGDADG